MTSLLEKAGASFLRAFAAGLVTYGVGVWLAPDLNAGIAVGAAAVASSLAAGISAAQMYLEFLTFKRWFGEVVGARVDSFARAFIGYSATAATGWLLAPDLTNWKAIAVGAITGAFAAGFRALQGAGTKGEYPAPGRGL